MGLGSFAEKAIAGRWIAGATIEDAIARSMELNRMGAGTILNCLGEEFMDKKDVEDSVDTYLELIKRIKEERINASISLKMSQLGLKLGKEFAHKNYARIVRASRKQNIFTWLDMEMHNDVSSTIAMYRSESGKDNVGICIQAYLKRSMEDVEKLVKERAVIRLVKGAYKENDTVAFQTREETTRNYARIMEYLFANSKRFTLGTHDIEMVKIALRLNKKYKRNVTYSMLNGIRNKFLFEIKGRGNSIAVYVPFGKRWVDYAYRRLGEEGHLSLLIKSIFEKDI